MMIDKLRNVGQKYPRNIEVFGENKNRGHHLMPEKMVNNLFASSHRCIEEVIQANGSQTKYQKCTVNY